MCYSPIKIRTNKYQYINGIDPVFMTVPCGHCRECHQRLQDDWFVRNYYEWLTYTQKYHGKMYFITLTYNDAELPHCNTALPEFYSLDVFLRNYIDGEYSISENIRNDFLARVDRYETRWNRSCLDRPIFDIPCFNKEHIKQFIKSLRQLLDYNNILHYDDLPLKYFAVTEYGDNFRRPHIHMEICVPFDIDDNLFLSLCRRAWSHRVNKKDVPQYLNKYIDEIKHSSSDRVEVVSSDGTNWNDWYLIYNKKLNRVTVQHSRGFVNYSEKDGVLRPCITDIQGVKYLTNYLTYYDSIMKNDFYEMVRDYCKLFPSYDEIKHLPKTLACLKNMREIFPFRMASQNYGFEFYVECGLTGKIESSELEFIRKNEITIPNDTRTYPIPQYLLNRIMYDDDAVPYSDRKVRLLSDVGVKVFSQAYDDKVKYKVRKYVETIQVLYKFLTPSDFDEWDKMHNARYKNEFPLVDCLTMNLGCDFEDVAIFDLTYKDVIYNESGDNLLFNSMSVSDFIDNARDLYQRQIESKQHFDMYYHDSFLSKNTNGYLRRCCFNTLPQLSHFDYFLSGISFVRKQVLQRDAHHFYDDEQKKSKVREALNLFKYPQ